jgi:hypothetical protein
MQWDRRTQPRHHLKTKDRFAIMLTPPTHSSRVSMSTNLAQILEEENNLPRPWTIQPNCGIAATPRSNMRMLQV